MKAAIITITSGANFGNRLQNYALQEVLRKHELDVATLYNATFYGDTRGIKFYLKAYLKKILKKSNYKDDLRVIEFQKFTDKYINQGETIERDTVKSLSESLNTKYDFFLTGSDQVWNPNYVQNSDIEYLSFAEETKRVAFSASFGVDKLKDEKVREVKEHLSHFKSISVREEAGAGIVKEITGNEPEVLVDPTLLLTKDEWCRIEKKPKWFNGEPYLLMYFFGDVQADQQKFINEYVRTNKLQIIRLPGWKNVENHNWNNTDPAEFLWLIRNSRLICTDSFHGSVFSIIMQRPFVLCERNDKDQKMNSRTDTLLKKFSLEKNRFSEDLDIALIEQENYEHCGQVIAKEIKKADTFIKKSLFNELEKCEC